MKSETVIVTGAVGFIGSYLIKELLNSDYSVIGIDLKNEDEFNFSQDYSSSNYKYAKINLEDYEAVLEFAKTINEKSVSILHLAGSRNNCNIENSDMFWNIVDKHFFPTINIFNAFKDKIRFFCYTSSMSVYGIPLVLPVSENHPENPTDAYGFSKLLNEGIIRSLGYQFDVPTAILRIASVYDKNQMSKAIENIKKNMEKKETITVYGSRTVSRDYIHISDLTDAIMSILNKEITGIFNIGSGKRTSLRKIIEILEDVFDSKTEITFDKTKSDSFDFELDINLARKILKFDPKFNILEVLKDE